MSLRPGALVKHAIPRYRRGDPHDAAYCPMCGKKLPERCECGYAAQLGLKEPQRFGLVAGAMEDTDMGLRQTHTFVELEVSAEAFAEIERRLRAAGYDHVFADGAIDMHGIGLVRERREEPPAPKEWR